MTLKEFNIQMALGLTPFTLERKIFRNYPHTNLPEFETYLVLKLGDKKYSSREHPWVEELTHYAAFPSNICKYAMNIRETLVRGGVLR